MSVKGGQPHNNKEDSGSEGAGKPGDAGAGSLLWNPQTQIYLSYKYRWLFSHSFFGSFLLFSVAFLHSFYVFNDSDFFALNTNQANGRSWLAAWA